ncbi:uncharacterized protein PG998_011491 [Apiospora kogelbergensis]|uniref:uncharacterized protein n=1 Tax=Apiospora kogelbergensis TaxID=1337665 RepID=UPI00313171D3
MCEETPCGRSGRVANWIDLVCHEFDEQHRWGSQPTNSAGKASLRSLWAYFIDKELEEIETKAKTLADSTETKFDKDFPASSLSPAEKKWYDDAFGTNGFATSGKMSWRGVAWRVDYLLQAIQDPAYWYR